MLSVAPLALAGGFLLLAGWTHLLAQAQPELRDIEVQAEADLVLVDVVVRDKDGRFVTSLSADDFTVFEDGAQQEVSYFRLVDGTPTTTDLPRESRQSKGVTNSAQPSAALGGERYVALVFHRLSPVARIDAWEAARTLLESEVPGVHFGVFSVDQRLNILQPFSLDRERIAAALARARDGVTSRWVSADDLIFPGQEGSPIARESQTELGDPGTRGQLVYLRMLRLFEELQRYYAGLVAVNALLAVVDGLAVLPGRKALILLSEGMDVEETLLWDRPKDIVAAANRAQVSIYSVDAAGLRLQSTGAPAAGMLQNHARAVAQRYESDGDAMALAGMGEVERALRSDPHLVLNRLARETGGMFLRSRNDLSAALTTIAGDLETYYLLGYRPTNRRFDGRFREIEVQVHAPEATTIRYRRGYYAIDRRLGGTWLESEAPAAALLHRTDRPEELPFRLGVYRIPTRDERTAVLAVATVPPGTIAYREAPDGSRVSDTTILVVARDEGGEIVAKASRQYRLREEKGERNRRDGLFFATQLRLTPGRYQIEAAIFDAVTGRGAVQSNITSVPRHQPRSTWLSDLVLVDATEKLRRDENTEDEPLRFGNLRVYPMLEKRIERGDRSKLVFFFALQPGAVRFNVALAEVQREGTVVTRSRLALPKPDRDGVIRCAGILPIGQWPPGAYSLRVTLPSSPPIDREVSFTVTE
ncbi:MAG: hypothetical protein Kow00109_14520 [Acidobacteriota bacterium]